MFTSRAMRVDMLFCCQAWTGLSHGYQGHRELSSFLSKRMLGAPQAIRYACSPLQARQPDRQDHRKSSRTVAVI
eukprot:357415-Chlamydomonas_euryale.AAC.5